MSDDTKKELTEDILGEFGFRVVWSYLPHWADVKVYEITGREHPSNKELFQRKDSLFSPDSVETIEGAEVYLEGYLKWDGCNELNQGDHHFCGLDQIMQHCMLLKYLWERAHQLMDNSDCKNEQLSH